VKILQKVLGEATFLTHTVDNIVTRSHENYYERRLKQVYCSRIKSIALAS